VTIVIVGAPLQGAAAQLIIISQNGPPDRIAANQKMKRLVSSESEQGPQEAE
jgi:hypothetical protein